jgi:hypothetical protein
VPLSTARPRLAVVKHSSQRLFMPVLNAFDLFPSGLSLMGDQHGLASSSNGLAREGPTTTPGSLRGLLAARPLLRHDRVPVQSLEPESLCPKTMGRAKGGAGGKTEEWSRGARPASAGLWGLYCSTKTVLTPFPSTLLAVMACRRCQLLVGGLALALLTPVASWQPFHSGLPRASRVAWAPSRGLLKQVRPSCVNPSAP